MRFPYIVVGVAFASALACATGQEIDSKHEPLVDAGRIKVPIDENGGSGGQGPVGFGGMIESGGAPVGMGGTPAAGGAAAGGKASGGSAGKATGGMASGSGGTTGSGGKGTGGAVVGNGGTDPGDGGNCQAGQKFCGGLCTPPAPRVGCGLTGCDPCTLTAPMNGYVTCANNQCVFDCLSGYMKNGTKCDGSGTGGNVGNCNLGSCAPCNIVSGPACCTSAGKCGCPLIPWVTPTCI